MTDRDYLNLAARLAIRAFGDVEPNPMVGAVIVRDGRVIGMGHHRKYGGLHAEREALADCRRRGEDPRGSTVYVTLEPCCHVGKQPPCTEALIEAGVARVVAARRDPNPVSGGGAGVLARVGIACEFTEESKVAIAISDPFVKRVTTGLPWVVAKWAQTLDGRLTACPWEPRWISGEVSRRRVHRLRARVDAIVTGIGTVLADDPMLTARGVRVHRIARRVVIDPRLEIPLESKLVRGAADAPLMIYANESALDHATREKSEELARRGIPVRWTGSPKAQRLDLAALLRQLGQEGSSVVMLECGDRLLHSFLEADLVDECLVHIGSAWLDAGTAHAAAEWVAIELNDPRFEWRRTRRSGADTEALFSKSVHAPAPGQVRPGSP